MRVRADSEKAGIDRRMGRSIRERREELRLNQRQLGHLVSLSRTSIANIEAGRQGLYVTSLYRFAKALACDPEDLLVDPPAEVDAEHYDTDGLVALVRERASNG